MSETVNECSPSRLCYAVVFALVVIGAVTGALVLLLWWLASVHWMVAVAALTFVVLVPGNKSGDPPDDFAQLASPL